MKIHSGRLAAMAGLAIVFLLMFPLSGAAQTLKYKVLHNFTGGWDGNVPSSLMLDGKGNMYGTVLEAGAHNGGLVFKLTPAGPRTLFAVIYNFGSYTGDGTYPLGPLVQGANGVLYGVTNEGGGPGAGTLFSLKPPPLGSVGGPWTETQLYAFTGGTDGGGPNGGLAMDAAGNLYGNTSYGGLWDAGTVFELVRSGSGWTYQVLYNFPSEADGYPESSVTLGPDGNLYGTAGVDGFCGEVYQVNPITKTGGDIYTFSNGSDGCAPVAGVAFDRLGNLFGATASGGANGGGVVYKLSPAGAGWAFTVLYSLTGDPNNWDGPQSAAVVDAADNLYFTTVGEGHYYGCGSVFEMAYGSSGWHYKSLYDFPCGRGGDSPNGVAVDARGWVYGTLTEGGAFGDGVAFEMLP